MIVRRAQNGLPASTAYGQPGGYPEIFGPNNYDGLIIQDWGVSMKKVTDGTSKTMMIGERWYQMRAWMIGTIGGFQRILCDCHRRQLDRKPPWHSSHPRTLRTVGRSTIALTPPATSTTKTFFLAAIPAVTGRLFRPASPKTISVNDLPFGSFHTGGASFGFGDGSVKFLPDDIDSRLYLALASRNGDETVSDATN